MALPEDFGSLTSALGVLALGAWLSAAWIRLSAENARLKRQLSASLVPYKPVESMERKRWQRLAVCMLGVLRNRERTTYLERVLEKELTHELHRLRGVDEGVVTGEARAQSTP